MDNLWKKDSTRAEYVDLFTSVKNSWFDMSIELLKTQKSRKNNQRSTEWRSKGNDFFRQENWMEAMKCYNQSLCFAEAGSENEALAYSNRSACYFHMMLFDEVLVDIEHAKNANLPDRLKPKLEQRKNDSLKMMCMVSRWTKFEPKLSYEADNNFPCMANVVEIKYNQEFGRHLVAKCDIPVGKTVLLEKDIPRIRDDMLVCYTCSQVYTSCVACPNCPDVTFCSVDCMNRNQTHKWECGSFFPHVLADDRLQIKILLIAIASFPSVEDLMQFVEDALLEDPKKLPTPMNDPKSKYHFLFKLSTSAPIASALMEAYKVYKTAISLPKVSGLFNSDRKKYFLMHLSLHHFLIFNTNVISAENSQLVAHVSSLLNHSCSPNIISSVFASSAFCVTGRPIKKGEQLFFKYSELEDSPPNERKTKLKSRWGFNCKCEKCEPTAPAPLDRKLITSDPLYKYVLENQENINESASVQEKCVKFLNKYGRSPWSPEIEFVFNVYGHHLALGLAK